MWCARKRVGLWSVFGVCVGVSVCVLVPVCVVWVSVCLCVFVRCWVSLSLSTYYLLYLLCLLCLLGKEKRQRETKRDKKRPRSSRILLSRELRGGRDHDQRRAFLVVPTRKEHDETTIGTKPIVAAKGRRCLTKSRAGKSATKRANWKSANARRNARIGCGVCTNEALFPGLYREKRVRALRDERLGGGVGPPTGVPC